MRDTNALYVCATPIGNLDDITVRALNVLRSVDVIAAEDTRHSGKLLQHFGIATPLVAYHDFSQPKDTERLLTILQEGKSVALISDAGTPLISDPGFKLVRDARAAGIKVVPIPGACAVVAALSAAGLPSDRFRFEGFPPAKNQAREQRFRALSEETCTLIFYESPHRIADSVAAMADIFGTDRQAVLAREISKTFETFFSGTLADLCAFIAGDPNQQRGECVVLLDGFTPPAHDDGLDPQTESTLRVLLAELPLKQAAAIAAKLTNKKKNRLYQWALQHKADEKNSND